MIALGTRKVSVLRVLQDLNRACQATIKGNLLIAKRGSPSPIITHDGMTILHEYPLQSPSERLVGGIVRQSALNLHREVGDGVKTFVRLVNDLYQAFVHEDLTRDIEEELYLTVKLVCGNFSEPCLSQELAHRVVMLASKGDVEAADLLSEAVTLIGKTGRVQFEDGFSVDTKVVYSEGLALEDCWVASELLRGGTERVFESPLVAVIKEDLHSFEQVQSLLETSTQWPLPLVVIAPLVMREALATFVTNDKENIKEVVVLSPRRDAELQSILEDLAAYSGATYINPSYLPLTDFQGEWLGSFRRLTVTSSKCRVIPFDDKLDDVLKYVKKLQRQADLEPSIYNRDRILRRVAALTDGLCLVQVGGVTEAERKNKRASLETTTRALQIAIQGGILLENPYLLMAENTSVPRLREALSQYNLETPIPTEVFRATVTKAISTAKLLLQTKAWVYK